MSQHIVPTKFRIRCCCCCRHYKLQKMSSREQNVPEGSKVQDLFVEELRKEPQRTEDSADTQPTVAIAEALFMEGGPMGSTPMDVEMADSDTSEPDDTAQKAVVEIVSTAEPKWPQEKENENDEQEAEENVESETSSESNQPFPDPPKRVDHSSTASEEDDYADREEAEEIADILVGAKEDEHIDDIEGSELSAKEASDSVARSIKLAAEESSAKVEPVYSTRGRHLREEEPLDDRKSRETSVREQIDEDREPGALPAPTSFLESLNEEDRRTRTRFLPDVDGFHALYKAEVKSDLALARSVVSCAGVTSTLSTRRPKGKKSQKDEDQMDLDDEEATGPSEDEKASDIVRVLGSAVVELNNKEFLVPSSAFIAQTNGDADGNGVSSKKAKGRARSPYVVEALAAFNPPRPPESVGAKKKHRMLRWERRPQDVEVDLANYKKTVLRTREELRNAEKERERIQMFGAILRVNYRDQLELLNEESAQLNEELNSVQTECVLAADLLTSRTRSRGTGKGSYLMKDVISVLKSRGAELSEKGIPAAEPTEPTNGVTGFGGVASLGFADWDKASEGPLQKIASAWTLPGDKVTTQYGDGVVLHVYGPSVLNVNETPPDDVHTKPPPTTTPVNGEMVDGYKVASPEHPSSSEKTPEIGHGFGTSEHNSDVTMETESNPPKEAASEQETPKDATIDTGEVKSNESADAPKLKEGDKTNVSPKHTPEKSSSNEHAVKEYRMDQILPPRVCVRLQFGVGFFLVSAVKSKENPFSYSDAQLASRWKKMVETASMVGSVLDVAGMKIAAPISPVDRDDTDELPMDVDAAGGEKENGVEDDKGITDAVGLSDAAAEEVPSTKRFLPFGSNLLPTVAGRGSLLAEAPITSLETLIGDNIFHSAGVLGSHHNPGVPKLAREWEDMRQDSYTLQAKVLHLRNELHRQRRIRALNERTFSTFSHRSLRGETLIFEMREDLKSLKNRLGDEVGELGIDGERAEVLLTSHFKRQDSADFTDSNVAPPPKRQRRVVKEAPPPTMKMTRRRRGNSMDFNGMEMASAENIDQYEDSLANEEMRDFGEDAGNAVSSDEDRGTKRARHSQ